MNTVVPTILASLRQGSPMRFDRFMALALYCPGSGYYEQKPDNPGPHGDYFTSVHVGPLFAELLAFQLADWLAVLARRQPEAPLRCVEAAAHDGRLARRILEWFAQHRPDLSRRLRYVILEPSERRRAWQRKTLGPWAEQVDWPGEPADLSDPDAPTWLPLPQHSIAGVVFSNELLDAFPVRRLCWDARARQWSEWGVAWAQNRFVQVRMPDNPDHTRERLQLLTALGLEPPPEVQAILPDGFTLDISPGAVDWWRRAARSLQVGWLMTIDYGLTAEECFQPHRRAGTLRAYYRHRLVSDPLLRPGEQDLTAHVIFSALQRAGEAAGLCTVLWQRQESFLIRIAERWAAWAGGRLPWDPARLRQFHTLVHPEHLGRAFQVFVQCTPGLEDAAMPSKPESSTRTAEAPESKAR
ncbi:MAG: SAM-dependent methyltransferase [Limisphaera sp.]|nr:SAM-dependent methyltransferase [Limisphaera sp.]